MKQKKIDIRPYTGEFYRKNGGVILLGVLHLVLKTAAGLILAWLLQQTIDLMSGADIGFTLGELFVFSLISLAVILAAYGCAYRSMPKFIARGMAQYKAFVFRKLCLKGMAAFSEESGSRYVSALSNDAAAIEANYLSRLFDAVGEILLFAAALAMMFLYSPLLTVISLGLSFLPLLASLLTGGAAAEAEKRVSDVNEQYMASLQDSLTGFAVIKAFRAEKQMLRLFVQKVREVAQAKERRQKISILIQMLSQSSGVIVQLGVFLAGAYLAASGRDVTAGTVLIFVQLLNYVLRPIGTVPGYLAGLRSSRLLIRKLAEALEDNVQETGTQEKTGLDRGIFVRELSFAYEPEKPVLKGVSYTFEAGKSYAVVGVSGSGKSTLLHLLAAAYPGYTGSIGYDDTELRDLSRASLYGMLSVIQQNVFVFNASVRDNITMFRDFPGERVDEAIRLSGLSSLIFEKGEAYLCGENGCNLSGGEKQRIAIARSLLCRAQVLLADEMTAALDAQTAFQVGAALLELEGMTRIVVTHALDAKLLRRYDGILTMKAGELAEVGTFDGLMRRKGYFYSLYTVSR